MKPAAVAAIVVLVAAAGGGAAWLLRRPPAAVAPPVAEEPAPASAPGAAAAPASAPASAALPQPAASSEPIAAEGVPAAIEGLVGRAALGTFQLDDFAHRLAATVDNLPREHASPALWPVAPTPGRFLVRTSGGATVIDPDNGQRYAPFVQLVERVDLARAVALYRRLYGLLQPAYEALGYPGKSFNDRLVASIDDLLAAPEPAGPLRVQLPQFNGTLKPARPWVLYEFSDPALESLSAGRKLMVRVGPVDERRLKTRLRELRALLVAKP